MSVPGQDGSFGPNPGLDSDGDYDAAQDLWASEAGGGVWTPDCWHNSPDALIAQARSQNEAGYMGVFAAAGRGSQPSHGDGNKF